MWETIVCKHKPSSASEAVHRGETLQKRGGQSLICEELQVPCVKEAISLQGGWEGLLGQFSVSPAMGYSHLGEVKQQSRVWDGLSEGKNLS